MRFCFQFVDPELEERLKPAKSRIYPCELHSKRWSSLSKSGQEFDYPVAWEMTQTEHERYLTEKIFKNRCL